MVVLIIYLFISGCAGSSLPRGLVSSRCKCGLLTAVASLVGEHWLSSTSSVVVTRGLVAPWYVGSSQTRD